MTTRPQNAGLDMWNAKIMSGTGAQVMKKRTAWQECIPTDGLMTLSLGHSSQAICHSTEIITDAYGLPDKYSCVDFTVA